MLGVIGATLKALDLESVLPLIPLRHSLTLLPGSSPEVKATVPATPARPDTTRLALKREFSILITMIFVILMIARSDSHQPAPEAGTWFQAYFESLVANASPAL